MNKLLSWLKSAAVWIKKNALNLAAGTVVSVAGAVGAASGILPAMVGIIAGGVTVGFSLHRNKYIVGLPIAAITAGVFGSLALGLYIAAGGGMWVIIGGIVTFTGWWYIGPSADTQTDEVAVTA